MRINLLITAAAAITLAATGYFFLAGHYNIAADDKHWPITENLISQVRDASINHQLNGINIPSELTNAERIRRGAGNYDAMCAACHLSPGKESGELQTGLYPQPPLIYKTGIADKRRAFWVIKHGVKMTGMPAWGKTNTDEDIWAIVAFLDALPRLDAAGYRALVDASGGHTHGAMTADAHHDDARNNSAKPTERRVPPGHDNSDGHHDTDGAH